MVATGVRPEVIYCAASRVMVEKDAIAACHSCQSKGLGLCVKVFHLSFLHESPGYLFGWLFNIKGVYEPQAYQVAQIHLDR